MRHFLCSLITFSLLGTLAVGQQDSRKYPPELPGAEVEVYKQVGDVELNIYIYTPEGHKASDRAAAIVFFFGGGWNGGSPMQFEQQCEYLASRGMVAMTADYRVKSRHGVKAVSCVTDAKSAVRWVRANADRLGIDPDRIAAGGGSAGGHTSACTGTVVGYEEKGEDLAISSVPNAMVLCNPATVLAPVEGYESSDPEKVAGLGERMGADPVELSPYHQVKPGNPPTIVFHGTGDTTVPFVTAELFTAAMKKAGNRCELVSFEGEPHGFFNSGRKDNTSYNRVMEEMDAFLVSLGFLEAAK